MNSEGFETLSRDIEVIRNLGAGEEDWRVLLRFVRVLSEIDFTDLFMLKNGSVRFRLCKNSETFKFFASWL